MATNLLAKWPHTWNIDHTYKSKYKCITTYHWHTKVRCDSPLLTVEAHFKHFCWRLNKDVNIFSMSFQKVILSILTDTSTNFKISNYDSLNAYKANR